MDWTKLDISRAAVLKKEVDLSMKFLKEAVFNGQDTRIQELLTSFWSQIAAIDSFCMEHHDDERSVLFEKEKKNLIDLLQELGLPTTSREAMDRSSKISGVADRKINKNNKNKTSSIDLDVDNKPIYAWELKNLEKIERSTISNEYGTFLPSLKEGIYTSVGDTTDVNTRHIDFQVILTEDEMMTIISRQKALRQEALHRQRFTERRKENRLGLMA